MADAMLYVVGLGPGDARYLTAQAQTALQAADVLYGVTMQEDGVSKILRLDLDKVSADLIT